MICHGFFLVRMHHAAFLLQAGDDTLDSFVEIRRLHGILALPRCQKSRFIDDVGEVRADESRSLCGDLGQVDRRRQFDFFGMEPENPLPPFYVGTVNQYLTIEPSGAQQRRVENFRPVGGGHDNDALIRVKSVHLSEQLIERLLALVMARQNVHATSFTERVELVDEYNARRMLHRLSKQITNPRRSDANEHLDEIGAGDAEKRHAGLAGDGTRQQGLSRARRTDEQDSLRDAAAEPLIFLWGPQKLDDLSQLLLSLVYSFNVGKRHSGFFLDVDFRFALADLHQAAAGGAHFAEQKVPDQEKEHDRHHPRE